MIFFFKSFSYLLFSYLNPLVIYYFHIYYIWYKTLNYCAKIGTFLYITFNIEVFKMAIKQIE
jgi:hypothetical protein